MDALTNMVIEPDMLEEMGRIAQSRAPQEACGVLIPIPHQGRQVFELPNRAVWVTRQFEISAEDIVAVLEPWVEDNPEAGWNQITIWHSHPKGQVGPSSMDLANRSEHCGNLVVSLTEDGPPLATWF